MTRYSLSDDVQLTRARLALVEALRITLANGLALLGLSAIWTLELYGFIVAAVGGSFGFGFSSRCSANAVQLEKSLAWSIIFIVCAFS